MQTRKQIVLLSEHLKSVAESCRSSVAEGTAAPGEQEIGQALQECHEKLEPILARINAN